MNAIEKLTERMKQVREALKTNAWLSEIVKEYDYVISDMNTEDQLYDKGINANSVDIMDFAPYSPVTVEYKIAKGQPYDRVTLRDTGDFHHGFTVNYSDKGFTITSTDSKEQFLSKKYGRDIFGLTATNKDVLRWEYIYPDIMDKLTATIYG